MRVVSLQVENVKRIEKLVVSPPGYAVKVAGRNGAGKSSAIDSLMYLLEGARSMPESPVRTGATKARIHGDFGEMEVTRTITEKGTTLTVHNVAGKVEKPQEFLDKLLGSATDVLEFFALEPAKQRQVIADMAGIRTDMMDADLARLEEDRRHAGRRAKEAAPDVDPKLPAEKVSIQPVLDELEAVRQHNTEVEKRGRELAVMKQRQEQITRECKRKVEELVALEAEVDRLKLAAAKLEDEVAEAERTAGELKDPKPLTDEVAEVTALNERIAENNRKREAARGRQQWEETHEKLSGEIEELRTEKARMIADAEYPVDGLTLGENGVLYGGVPLNQLSAAQRIVLGIQIMANTIPAGGIRVLRVSDASLLDSESMAEVERAAEAHEVQVWLELVRDMPDGDQCIYIRDGKAGA